MTMPAALAAGGGDPRLNTDEGKGPYGMGSIPYTKPQLRRLHDDSVTFEEYLYYADLTRKEEEEDARDMSKVERGVLSLIFPSKNDGGVKLRADGPTSPDSPDVGLENEKPPLDGEKRPSVVHNNLNLSNPDKRAVISDEEWKNASRALRTASWGAIFYLITTDILGPFGLPYAFASMGWGPGIALFTVFAVLAGYSGYLLWDMFLGLDSYEFPVKHFGDLGYRIFGKYVRWLFNLLQAIQLTLNVGLIVISNGEALSQAAKFRLCFAICCLVWCLAGFVFGQIRTLQKFGWLANAAVWINLLCMFVSMGGAANYPPNYASATQAAGAGINGGVSVAPISPNVYPAVQTSGGLPDSGDFKQALSGAMNAVFSYGGAMVFPEFMSEMKRPRDFLKGMWAAQLFIYIVYMFYGLFIYGYQGQYAVNPSYLGISEYGIQTAGNVFAMISALIAAALYGNIGVKVIYNNIFVEFLSAPPLTTKAGKIGWVVLIPVYWSIAFVIAAGIPNFSGLTSVVAAFCILHFTYSFPPLLSIGYLVQKNSMRVGDGFDPATGRTTSQGGFGRYVRGFMAGRWYMNVFNIIYFLGALVLSGMGAWAAITSLADAFSEGSTTSFVCQSPVEG